MGTLQQELEKKIPEFPKFPVCKIGYKTGILCMKCKEDIFFLGYIGKDPFGSCQNLECDGCGVGVLISSFSHQAKS